MRGFCNTSAEVFRRLCNARGVHVTLNTNGKLIIPMLASYGARCVMVIAVPVIVNVAVRSAPVLGATAN